MAVRSCKGAQTESIESKVFVFKTVSTNFVTLILLARSDENSGNDKLKDAGEDKYHTNKHPDIKEGHVRNTGNILPHLTMYVKLFELRYMFTELNIAVRVRRVVIPIPTLPGTDSAGMKSDSQARIWRKIMILMMIQKTYSPQTL